jgi:hypothetical protein
LMIEVRPTGGKLWVVRYWIAGKERRKSMGTYPNVTLKEAMFCGFDLSVRVSQFLDPSPRSLRVPRLSSRHRSTSRSLVGSRLSGLGLPSELSRFVWCWFCGVLLLFMSI